jgi:hypothetical protein
MGAKTKYNFRNRYTFWVHFRYKNGDCVENDYYAVSGPSGAPDCRDSFVSRCRITLNHPRSTRAKRFESI